MADKKRRYKDGFGSSKEWTERELLPEMNDCTSPEMSRPGGGKGKNDVGRKQAAAPRATTLGLVNLSGLDGPFHFHSFVCLTGCGEERQSLVADGGEELSSVSVVPYCGRGNTEHMPRIRKVWYGHLFEEEIGIHITECEVDTGIASVWNTSSLAVMVNGLQQSGRADSSVVTYPYFASVSASSWALWQMCPRLQVLWRRSQSTFFSSSPGPALFTFLYLDRASKVAAIP
ncbi:hypothetical protein An04g00280 [Aspergillus niger]|uniref:Uncharacterized protein n=2 Tax=Aspergillus niger TaxID=5061 RepID=A2QHL3_ASPNC|nr:hypothetical protein An04g00280 [Aspergillus niger]CAK38483.1 hypothetical protein An04g00280 [Aspergillus niger]